MFALGICCPLSIFESCSILAPGNGIQNHVFQYSMVSGKKDALSCSIASVRCGKNCLSLLQKDLLNLIPADPPEEDRRGAWESAFPHGTSGWVWNDGTCAAPANQHEHFMKIPSCTNVVSGLHGGRG